MSKLPHNKSFFSSELVMKIHQDECLYNMSRPYSCCISPQKQKKKRRESIEILIRYFFTSFQACHCFPSLVLYSTIDLDLA